MLQAGPFDYAFMAAFPLLWPSLECKIFTDKSFELVPTIWPIPGAPDKKVYLLFPIGREDPLSLVVSSQSVNAALYQNQTELGILILKIIVKQFKKNHSIQTTTKQLLRKEMGGPQSTYSNETLANILEQNERVA